MDDNKELYITTKTIVEKSDEPFTDSQIHIIEQTTSGTLQIAASELYRFASEGQVIIKAVDEEDDTKIYFGYLVGIQLKNSVYTFKVFWAPQYIHAYSAQNEQSYPTIVEPSDPTS